MLQNNSPNLVALNNNTPVDNRTLTDNDVGGINTLNLADVANGAPACN